MSSSARPLVSIRGATKGEVCRVPSLRAFRVHAKLFESPGLYDGAVLVDHRLPLLLPELRRMDRPDKYHELVSALDAPRFLAGFAPADTLYFPRAAHPARHLGSCHAVSFKSHTT